MAVRKEATIHRYIGLSTDTKSTGVPAGSTFYEYNTKDLYITRDGTNWVLKQANVNYAEDSAHATGDEGTLFLTVRKDTAAALSGTDNDYTPLIVDANGRLHVLDQNSAAIKTAVELIVSGAYTTPAHTNPTIGATTTAALASNDDRLYALLVNDSDETIYIKLGANAVMNQGIRLNASGGSYEMSKKLGNLYTGAINGICASGSKVLLVTEGV